MVHQFINWFLNIKSPVEKMNVFTSRNCCVLLYNDLLLLLANCTSIVRCVIHQGRPSRWNEIVTEGRSECDDFCTQHQCITPKWKHKIIYPDMSPLRFFVDFFNIHGQAIFIIAMSWVNVQNYSLTLDGNNEKQKYPGKKWHLTILHSWNSLVTQKSLSCFSLLSFSV